MKKNILLITAALCLQPCLSGAETKMTSEEREKVIQLLHDSQKEFIALVEGLSDEQWKWKPTPERWSVGEVAEHILLAEGSLFAKMKEALDSPPNPEWEAKTAGKTETLLKIMAPRLGKAVAPEPIQPNGKLSRSEIMSRFAEARAGTVKFTEETQLALKEHTSEHPFKFFGTLNAYQWLIYIPLHNMRHDKQIQEVMATAGFPK